MHSIKLNHFSSSHKLPGASIQCIYQDKVGLFWLGIESEGITKYDGKSITVYKNIPNDTSSLSNNFPIAIIEDDMGNIWSTTLFGLNKINRETQKITRYLHSPSNPNSIANNYLQGITKDKFGNLWIATSNGVSILNPNKNEFYNLFNNPDPNTPTKDIPFTSFHIDSNNNIWIASSINGLYMIEEKDYSEFMAEWKNKSKINISSTIENINHWNNEHTSSGPNAIRAIASTNPDTIWLGTQSGLYIFTPKNQQFIKKKFSDPVKANLNNCTYLDLFVDSRENLWAGTSNDGIIVINTKNNAEHFINSNQSSSNKLFSNAIREIIEAQSGLIWIATKFAGLHYYDKRQEQFMLLKKGSSTTEGLSNSYCLSLAEDRYNNIWIGTKNGGLNKYDRNTGKIIHILAQPGVKNALQSNRIEMITQDINGDLWMATENGLSNLNITTNNFKTYFKKHFRNILYTSKQKLWLGTDNGLFIFDPKTKKLHNPSSAHTDFFNTESSSSFNISYEDKNGIIWIGSQANGLYKYEPERDKLVHFITIKSDSTSLSGNMIRSIYEDSQGNLWIGTKSDGFNKLDRKKNKFIRYSNPQEFPSNTVYHMIEDNNHNLWFGTHNGIIKYTPTTNEYVSFNTNYGVQSLIFEAHAFCKTADGTFLMGGSQGLNIFDPDKIKKETYSAPLIISNFNSFSNSIDNDISNTKRYELSRDDNYLTIEFALLDYSNPDENQYEYQLENFDDDWIYSENRNYATYTNLPPGEYKFNVKGANSDGDWTEEPFSISFFIPAPIYQKAWFIILIILFLISAIISIYYLRINRIKKHELQLKKIVRQRTKDLSEAYQKLEISKKEIEHTNTELMLQQNKIRLQNSELENHRKNLENIVNERTKDLEKAKVKAEESDKLKSAFLANMSHEIRTPLNAIMGFIDILEANVFDKSERDKINQIIHSNGNTLLQLINDIIDISIIEANQIKLTYSTIKVNKFLEYIKTDYQTHKELSTKDVVLILEIPDKKVECELYTAPERLKQILTNLINNAIKFTSSGFIKFGYNLIGKNDNKITFYVKDSGIGISNENQALIFDRFRKIESKTKVFRGTGLGLSICKNLSQLLGGNIWVKSSMGEGSQFYFDIPIKKLNTLHTEDKNDKKQQHDKYDWKGKTILVAEDENSNFDIIQYILKPSNIKIIRAHDGEEAVQLVKSNSYNYCLVLMDIKMPIMDGITAMKLIKKENPELVVIAQTAYALQQEKENYINEGFEDYLTKPISSQLLYEKMAKAINKK